jgi:hypothetical protein
MYTAVQMKKGTPTAIIAMTTPSAGTTEITDRRVKRTFVLSARVLIVLRRCEGRSFGSTILRRLRHTFGSDPRTVGFGRGIRAECVTKEQRGSAISPFWLGPVSPASRFRVCPQRVASRDGEFVPELRQKCPSATSRASEDLDHQLAPSRRARWPGPESQDPSSRRPSPRHHCAALRRHRQGPRRAPSRLCVRAFRLRPHARAPRCGLPALSCAQTEDY